MSMLSGQKVDFLLSLLALFCYWDSATTQLNTGPPASMSAPHGLGALIQLWHEKHIPQCPGQYGDIPLLWGQGAEELPAPLISSGEHDEVYPDPPHGDSPSQQSVPGELAMGSASSRTRELSDSLPNLPKLLGLPANRGWRREKGNIGDLKCHRTSLHHYGLPSSCPACWRLLKEPAPEEGCTSLPSVTAQGHNPAH